MLAFFFSTRSLRQQAATMSLRIRAAVEAQLTAKIFHFGSSLLPRCSFPPEAIAADRKDLENDLQSMHDHKLLSLKTFLLRI
jgi:hypothetical protein